jgi:hypothetical protein
MQCGKWRKPTTAITDRAKRYRAQQCVPPGPKRCALCNGTRNLVVDHRDGDESNGRPGNLRYLCKRCNTVKGLRDKRQGRGTRTRQYNPSRLYRWSAPRYGGGYEQADSKGAAKEKIRARLGLKRSPSGLTLEYVKQSERPALTNQLGGLLETQAGLSLLDRVPGPDRLQNPQWARDVLAGRVRGDLTAARRALTNPGRAPASYAGRFTFKQVAAAVASVSPQKKAQGAFFPEMDLRDAREIIREVEAAGDMPRFQREVWRIRKQRYGSGGGAERYSAVPF